MDLVPPQYSSGDALPDIDSRPSHSAVDSLLPLHEVDLGTDALPLSLEQETCFKQQLLKLAIQREIRFFFEKPHSIDSTLFLSFIYHRLLEFPLWQRREHATEMFKELVMSLPELCVHSQKATKRDAQNKSMRQLVVKCFDHAVRTPQEKAFDDEQARNTDWDIEIDTSNEEEMQRGIKLARTLKTMSELFHGILVDVEKKGGYYYLFQLLRRTPHFDHLPSIFHSLGSSVSQSMSLWIEKELRDERQVAKLKRVYRLTPTRAIRAALGIANPVKLMQGLLSIFIARPFGSHNLIQKFAEIMVEMKKTQKLIAQAHKAVEAELKNVKAITRKCILQKVAAYVDSKYSVFQNDDPEADEAFAMDNDYGDDGGEKMEDLLPRELVTRVLSDDEPPNLDSEDIEALSSLQVLRIRELVILMMRLKEKRDFVELLGEEHMLKILKELLPVVYEPIARLFNKAHVGHHFVVLFKTLKRVIKVAEKEDISVQQRLALYTKAFDKFVRDLYAFLHHVAANDDDTLGGILKWGIALFAFMKHDTIDVHSLLESEKVNKETKEQLMKEIDEVVEYRIALLEYADAEAEAEAEEEELRKDAQGQQIVTSSVDITTRPKLEKPQRPTLTAMPKIVNDFVNLVAARLRNADAV